MNLSFNCVIEFNDLIFSITKAILSFIFFKGTLLLSILPELLEKNLNLITLFSIKSFVSSDNKIFFRFISSYALDKISSNSSDFSDPPDHSLIKVSSKFTLFERIA